MTPLVIAHRGNSSERPENTLASFRDALALGAPIVELDVHLTRDGVVVVIHDETLDRTTDGQGRVAELSFDELRRHSAGYPSRFGSAFVEERVPRLEEVLELIRGRARLLIELKHPEGAPVDGALERATSEIVSRAGLSAETAFISFSRVALGACRSRAPELPRGLLAYRVDDVTLVRAARELECALILPEKGMLSPALVARAHDERLDVATWIVDDPQELEALAPLGLVGVGSNRPGALLAHLAASSPRS
jgi:glycerophosphoryl diester phosphodiesterase